MGDSQPSDPGATAALEVSAGLVFRDGRLLIAQRRDFDHQGGLWEFPGGKRLPGESFEDCLRRELWEELGIEVSVGKVLESITHVYPDRTVHLRFFRCQWVRHEPRALGCQDFAWVTLETLVDYPFPAADARLLAMLRSDQTVWEG